MMREGRGEFGKFKRLIDIPNCHFWWNSISRVTFLPALAFWGDVGFANLPIYQLDINISNLAHGHKTAKDENEAKHNHEPTTRNHIGKNPGSFPVEQFINIIRIRHPQEKRERDR